VIRLRPDHAIVSGSFTVAPATTDVNTGVIYVVEGGAGVADVAGIVLKNAADTHENRALAFADELVDASLAPLYAYARIDAARNLVDDTSDQPIFPTTGDALTVVEGATYEFHARYFLTKGANSVNARPLFLGTATFTTFTYHFLSSIVTPGNIQAIQGTGRHAVASTSNVAASGTGLGQEIILDGEFEVNAGGTIIPAVNWSGATGSTPTVVVGTSFRVWELGANPVTTIGPWS
jgi:hypothetical protein